MNRFRNKTAYFMILKLSLVRLDDSKNPLIVVPHDEIKMVMIQLRSILMICKQGHSFKGKQGTSLNVLKGKQKHQTIKVLWAGCTYNELYYVGGMHAEYSSS